MERSAWRGASRGLAARGSREKASRDHLHEGKIPAKIMTSFPEAAEPAYNWSRGNVYRRTFSEWMGEGILGLEGKKIILRFRERISDGGWGWKSTL